MLQLLSGIIFLTFLCTRVAFAGEELYSPSQGALEYRLSNGRTVSMEYVDNSTIRRSSGVTVHMDQWGNKLRKTGSYPVTFEPHNGQLPESPLNVGLKWEHSYHLRTKKESYWRERECQVIAREQLAIAAGTFQNAWRIQCKNQRTDRSLPKHEVTWYSSSGRIMLHHRESWHGSDPGSFEAELIDLEIEPKTIIFGSNSQ